MKSLLRFLVVFVVSTIVFYFGGLTFLLWLTGID